MFSSEEWYLTLGAWQICGLLFVFMVSNGLFSTPPSELVLGIAGYLVSLERVPAWAALLAGVGGNVVGTSLLFFLAGRWGERVVRRILIFNPLLSDNLLAATREAFRRHGASIVLVGRCLPMVRSVISIPAGLTSMPWAPFLCLTTIGCLLWSLLWGGAGYIVGEQIQGLIREMKVYALTLTGIIVSLVFLWLNQQMHRYLKAAPQRTIPIEVPARFSPRHLSENFLESLWQLGDEIFFAPLTNFIRVQRISHGKFAERWRYLVHSAIVSFGTQVFYIVVATLFLGLLTGGQAPSRAQVMTGVRWGAWAFLATVLFGIAWHVVNNYRDVPGEYGRHFYVAVNRVLNRGMVVAHGGFFIGVGIDLLKSSSYDRLFQPALLAFSLCGLVIGVALRLILSIVHFEPLLLAKRSERFYLETWVKRRNFCRLVIVSGAVLILVALFFWNASGLSPGGDQGAVLTSRFLWLAAGYLGLVAVVVGTLTAWGFVFPWSWLRHVWLLWRHSIGRIDALTALRKSPLTYDELFMVSVPGVQRLLLALARERDEKELLPVLFFVLTGTYKIKPAARAIAELIENETLRPETVLAHLREHPLLSDVLPRIAHYLPDSVTRSVFLGLDGPLSLGQLCDLRRNLEESHVRNANAAVLVSALRSWEELVQAETLAEWPWRPGIEHGLRDLLGLGSELRELAQAKDLYFRVSRRAPYQERAQALHRSIEILRQARERLAADPWFGSLATKALDRFLDRLYMAMHRVLLSADLEVYVLPVPLQAGIEQGLVVTLTNNGPGRAQDVRVRLIAQGDIESEAQGSEILVARERQRFVLTVHPLRPGLLRGEIELFYRDDLLQERHQLQPVELTVQGRVVEFRDFPNPFIIGPPLREPDLFRGRTAVLKSFGRAPYPSLLVTGPPRIGKTSLLYQMRSAAGERPCLLLDLQRYLHEFIPERLSQRLASALNSAGSQDVMEAGSQDVIEALGSFLGRRTQPLLLVDECGYLPEIDARLGGRLGAELRGALNALDCQLVLAGSLSVGKESSVPLAQLSLMLEQVKIGLLRPDECAVLLTEPLAGKLSALPNCVSRFVGLTGGHPFVTQRLAHTITEAARERQQGVIDDALLDEAAEIALVLLEPLFRSFWSPLVSAHQAWLLEVAHGVAGNAPMDVALLQDLCLIASSRPGAWHIPIGLFERWLHRTFELPPAGLSQGGRT
jgi:membrane protein DedA with SNARE-associated domain